MSRSSSGIYTLPVPPFVAGTVIKSADVNLDFSDIATALTQSLATTGVSSMTGPIKAAAGSAGAPSYSFASGLTTGFYLAGTDQIGWSAAGVLAATFNADGTTTWLQTATFTNLIISGTFSIAGTVSVGGDLRVAGSTFLGGNLQVVGSITSSLRVAADVVITGSLSVGSNAGFSGNVVISSLSMYSSGWIDLQKQVATVSSPAANRLRFYVKLDGVATGERPYAVDENGLDFPLMFTGGQCQLTLSGTSLLLSPFQGNRLSISGVPQIVPDGGITLAASNTAAVFLYIYAFMNAGTMTLEKSTTVPVIQNGTGVKIKTGDASRTLVGAAYTDAGGAWADTNGKLWVLSYFNRRRKDTKTVIVTSLSTTVTIASYIEVDSGMRNNFINWADEVALVDTKLETANSGVNTQTYLQNNLDGLGGDSVSFLANTVMGLNHSIVSGATENTTHYISPFIRTIFSSATVVCSTGSSAGEASSVYITIRG